LTDFKVKSVFYAEAFYGVHLQVKDFVSRYLPAYKAYLPTLSAEGPRGSHPENLLLIEIDEGRNPILGN
jgi:D-glycerate 3-kinase